MSSTLHRRCWVEVDGRALRHNFKILRGLIPPTTQVMAVVKANAYGHGLVATARELEAIGTDWLGVANVAEGEALREAGVKLPILLLSATLPEEMDEAVRHKLTLTLSSYQEAKALDRIARARRRKADVHFKIDTARMGSASKLLASAGPRGTGPHPPPAQPHGDGTLHSLCLGRLRCRFDEDAGGK